VVFVTVFVAVDVYYICSDSFKFCCS